MCTQPLPRTGTGGSPLRPASSTSTPCCPPHQRRAAARPVKFAIVAPLVKTPLHAAGSPNSSLSQSSEICSSRMANGELTQLKAIWSSALVSQSAARAAGVPPPITKWKKRGPAERVAPSEAASISARRAASEPAPSSGSAPPRRSAGSPGPGGRTGAPSSCARYRVASSATRRSDSSSASRSRIGSATATMLERMRGPATARAGAGRQRRTSRTMLNGDSYAWRIEPNPASRKTSARRVGPAWAPRASPTFSDRECGTQIAVEPE